MFKPFGPGSATGGETTTQNSETGSPGPGTSYYPPQEGKSVGGDEVAPKAPHSDVPSRPNPQSGDLGGLKADMEAAVRESAAYGGQDGDCNPTGSSVRNPAGARSGEDDGFYGERPASTPGTNADGSGSGKASASRGYSRSDDDKA